MTERVMFVDGVAYSEADMATFQQKMRPDGVMPESSGTYAGLLAVSAPGAMVVRVASGEMMIQGFLYQNDANKDLTIGNNTSGSTRIDLVVVRMDRAANSCVAVIKVGTPGAGAPALTQVAGGLWEYSLAQVTVANGAASIVAGNLLDQRSYSKYPKAALDNNALSLVGGLTVAGGIAATGGIAVTGASSISGGLTISTGGLAVSAGGLRNDNGQFYTAAGYYGFFDNSGTGAQATKVGSLVVSSSYSDVAPTNGIYSLGTIQTNAGVLAGDIGAGTPAANTMYRQSVVKAWGNISGGAVSLGYNIASVSVSGSSITITFKRGLTTANCCAVACGLTATYKTLVTSITTTTIGFTTFNNSGSLAGVVDDFHFILMGNQ